VLLLGLGLGEADALVWLLPGAANVIVACPVVAHNEQSAIPSAISRRELDIIPLLAVVEEELLALESNTFLPELLVI